MNTYEIDVTFTVQAVDPQEAEDLLVDDFENAGQTYWKSYKIFDVIDVSSYGGKSSTEV